VKRKTWVLTGATVLSAVIVTGGVLVASGSDAATEAARRPPANTAKVQRGELSAIVSLDGTLAYRARPDGSPFSAINQATGTYTKLPGEGREVDCGDVFYRVQEDPVMLLCGTVPAYRDLNRGDRGRDVRQLNRNLRRLGYDADPSDNRFTAKTKHALEQLQRNKGSSATGKLHLGDAVVLPKPVRISKVSGRLGESARPGAQVAQATSDRLEVQVELEATQQREVKQGDRAQITLPSNATVTGTVDRLGRVARAPGKDDGAAEATIPAYIGLDKPDQARGLDQAPVHVDVTTEGVKSALSVPVIALVGKSGGGFAVEVVRGGGRRELVAVKLGLFDTAAGRVQVEGALVQGDQVVVPSL
jgi:peptidoglycan hydrolase-like protein with peptidoglycan-binding domain